MLVPIYGGSYDTHDGEWAAYQSATVGSPTDAVAGQSLSVRGPREGAVTQSLSVGPRYYYSAESGLTIGDGRDNHADSFNALTVRGLNERRAARMGLTVADPARAWAALRAITVASSSLARAVARMGLTVRGTSTRASREALTVRALRDDAARASIVVAQSGRVYVSRAALTVGAGVDGIGRMALEVSDVDGFFILADVLGRRLVNPAPVPGTFYPFQDITAQLLVDGEPVAIKSFDYAAPPDKLGASLNIALADVEDRARMQFMAQLDFNLVLFDYLGGPHVVALVADGKIGGRDYSIRWSGSGPADELTVSAVDSAQDKFNLCPRIPVTMFDPEKVDYASVEVKPRDAIQNDAPEPRRLQAHSLYGGTILPLLEPHPGLTWLAAARRAYLLGGSVAYLRPSILARLRAVLGLIDGGLSATTFGLGFEGLITNIPDYPVARVDFTIGGGWHDGIQPCIGMYGPIYFVEFARLFIIDARRALPFGYVAHQVTESQYEAFSEALPYRDPFNAVLLTYQYRDDTLGLTVSEEWLPQEVDRQGNYGELGFQETTVRQKMLRVRDAEGNVVNEEPTLYRQEIRATMPMPDGSAGPVMTTHEEEQQDFYSDNFKTGHHKEVRTLVTSGPTASLELVTALKEDCSIAWRDDPMNPGQKIQESSFTLIEGLIYESTDTTSRINPETGEKEDAPVRYPALKAQSSGILEDDGSMAQGPIKSITERLRPVKANQVDNVITERDLITGATVRGTSQPRVSSGLLSLNKYEARSRTILLRNRASEAEIGPRRPESVNAGELPYELALELGHRVLAEGFNPPLNYTVALPGVDVSIRRGTVLKARNRAGDWTPPVIVVGFNISGRNLGETGHRISQSCDCVELRG